MISKRSSLARKSQHIVFPSMPIGDEADKYSAAELCRNAGLNTNNIQKLEVSRWSCFVVCLLLIRIKGAKGAHTDSCRASLQGWHTFPRVGGCEQRLNHRSNSLL